MGERLFQDFFQLFIRNHGPKNQKGIDRQRLAQLAIQNPVLLGLQHGNISSAPITLLHPQSLTLLRRSDIKSSVGPISGQKEVT